MTEKEPKPATEPIPIENARRRRSRRGAQRWDIEGVAYHLRSEAFSLEDPLFGAGMRLSLGVDENPVAALELYPESAAARFRSRNLLIELSGLVAPALPNEDLPPDRESVLLLSKDKETNLRVGLSAQGEISLFIAPTQVLEAEPSSLAPQESGDAAPTPTESTELKSTEKGVQERVAITGRVGADLAFRSTPKGVLVASFPLAQREEESTVWHQIRVFGQRAESLREALKKGQTVQIIGYVHEREVQGRDGQNKLVKEIYAALIKPQG